MKMPRSWAGIVAAAVPAAAGMTRSVNELACVVIAQLRSARAPLCHPRTGRWRWRMVQTVPLVWSIVGALLFGMATRVALPPVPWIGLPLLIHFSRSMPVVPGLPVLWLALWISMVIARRGAFPMPGAIYVAVMAAEAATVTLAFIVDRAAAARLGPVL